jgi:4'-phosphopantetheinyl transferase EntD
MEASGSEASSELLTSIVGVGEDRCPIWPKGFVGSISHSHNWTFAIAASETALSGIGIDTEVILASDTHEIVRPEVGTGPEWDLLRERSLPPEVETTLLFSVKETYFKLWYPRIRQFYNFDDVQLVQVADLPCSRFAPTEAPLSFHLHTRHGWTESGKRPDQQFVTRVDAFWTDEDVFSLAWWIPASRR